MNTHLKIPALLAGIVLCLATMAVHAAGIHATGGQLKDAEGRTLMLRGINLGGSAKVPSRPNGATHLRDGFYDYRQVSFVGRPFPLAEADEHFARLKQWGLTLVRLVVTWEAIEHAGPGQYDRAYLAYLRDLVTKAEGHGLQVIIDPHQDAWSRWTGGSGAPAWTLEMAGMDLRKLHSSGAALTHQLHEGGYSDTDWVANYNRYGAATMFTLFFGGNDFAPQLKPGGMPIQEFLQSHYVEAFRHLALALKDLPNVVGFGVMNEPGRGYIGLGDLRQIASSLFLTGPGPTPFEGMLLAAGYPQQVTVMDARGQPSGKTVLNPGKARLASDGAVETWKRHGVWVDNGGQPALVKPDYFSRVKGRPVDFVGDYLAPFVKRYRTAIQSAMPDALVFVESVAAGDDVKVTLPANATEDIVFAPKWYDGPTKASRAFYPWLDQAGREAAKRGFMEQLAALKASAAQRMPGVPMLISEFGMPINLEGGKAYRTGDYGVQEEAFNSYFAALEANLLSAAIWNYTADNTHANGDQWNTEDYSIFSRDDKRNGGGRAVHAIVRPYPARTTGEPLRLRFDPVDKTFEYEYRPDPGIAAPTEIFVPALQYPQGYEVAIDGGVVAEDRVQQQLRVTAKTGANLVRLRIVPKNL